MGAATDAVATFGEGAGHKLNAAKSGTSATAVAGRGPVLKASSSTYPLVGPHQPRQQSRARGRGRRERSNKNPDGSLM